jgi:hypothetical protein
VTARLIAIAWRLKMTRKYRYVPVINECLVIEFKEGCDAETAKLKAEIENRQVRLEHLATLSKRQNIANRFGITMYHARKILEGV